MPHESTLVLVEREFFREQYGPHVRNIEPGEGVLVVFGIERIRRPCQRVTGQAGAENFAYVIQRPAEGIAGANRQLFEQVVGAELNLHSVVVGIAPIGPLADDALVAIDATNRLRNGCLARRTWRQTRGKVGERPCQVGDERIAVDRLEQRRSMITNVARFHRRVLADLSFNA